jgi:hypothetical protein
VVVPRRRYSAIELVLIYNNDGMAGTEIIPPLSLHTTNNEENTQRFIIEPLTAAGASETTPAKKTSSLLGIVNDKL